MIEGVDRKYCYIYTFGCQMNVHDSEQLAELLQSAGYVMTNDMFEASLIIINTCSVRAKAEQKVHSLIGRMRTLKKRNPALILGIIGCLAQQIGKKFFKRAPHLDLVCGTHNIHRIPEMIAEIKKTGSQVSALEFRNVVKSLGIVTKPQDGRVSAFVTIMQGCNNFCAYCIVPFLRGREESRNSQEILEEIKILADHGIKEVTLLGQNVNSYGQTIRNGSNFALLLKQINEVNGIERIRFTSSHPKDLSDELIRCFADVEKLCEHIHLPVQSGSDEILRRMKRQYSSSEYLAKVQQLRKISPRISITSDIIVGFPGESDDDFQKTIDLIDKVRFDNSFSFKYSDRPGIDSVRYDDKIDETVKSERLRVLQSLQTIHTKEKNKDLKGSIEDVLIEGMSKNSGRDVMGRTRTNKIVNFKGSIDLKGKIVPVKITRAFTHSLRGEPMNQEEIRRW